MASKSIALTFALYVGDKLVRSETMARDIVKVGRDPSSHLQIDEEQASRMHAVIEAASPQDITLIDLGNELGTTVNGARISKCKLSEGDRIRIGDTEIVLQSVAVEAAVAVAESPASLDNPFGGDSPFEQANPFLATGALAARQNPFAPPPSASEVPADAPEGSYEYRLVKGGLEVTPA